MGIVELAPGDRFSAQEQDLVAADCLADGTVWELVGRSQKGN